MISRFISLLITKELIALYLKIATIIIAFLLNILVAKIFNVEDAGKFFQLNFIILILTQLALLGFDSHLIKSNKLYKNLYKSKLVLAASSPKSAALVHNSNALVINSLYFFK